MAFSFPERFGVPGPLVSVCPCPKSCLGRNDFGFCLSGFHTGFFFQIWLRFDFEQPTDSMSAERRLVRVDQQLQHHTEYLQSRWHSSWAQTHTHTHTPHTPSSRNCSSERKRETQLDFTAWLHAGAKALNLLHSALEDCKILMRIWLLFPLLIICRIFAKRTTMTKCAAFQGKLRSCTARQDKISAVFFFFGRKAPVACPPQHQSPPPQAAIVWGHWPLPKCRSINVTADRGSCAENCQTHAWLTKLGDNIFVLLFPYYCTYGSRAPDSQSILRQTLMTAYMLLWKNYASIARATNLPVFEGRTFARQCVDVHVSERPSATNFLDFAPTTRISVSWKKLSYKRTQIDASNSQTQKKKRIAK